MSCLLKLRKLYHGLKWVPLPRLSNKLGLSMSNFHVYRSRNFCHPPRFYTGNINLSYCRNLSELAKRSIAIRREAQAALFDYFHGSVGLPFIDAENMSKKTPNFFDNFAKCVDVEGSEVKKSVTRFLRYHPVNEFEAFLESIGLKPCEYMPFLSKNMMYLRDNELLMENYYILCNHGFGRNWIGKIYKEATEIFQYESGVLSSKLQFLQDLGLKHSLVTKFIASTPQLLIGNIDPDFVEVISKLKRAGTQYDHLEGHICIEHSYNWKRMLKFMHLFREFGLNEEQIGRMCSWHPQLLLECSGHRTFFLFGFLLKFGYTLADVCDVFLHLPELPAGNFSNNVFRSYKFLVQIGIGIDDIAWFVQSHLALLGSCELKGAITVTKSLNCRKVDVSQMLKDDPYVLKKWVVGARVDRVQEEGTVQKARKFKTEFLLSLGYVDKSEEMEKTLKDLRGRGADLNERFHCLENIGLSREEVISMIRRSPRILNQSKDVLVTKVGFLLKDLRISVPELLAYPKLLLYTIPRIKVRFLFYKWLKDIKGAVRSKLALSTLLSISDKEFIKSYVEPHHGGKGIWDKLKKQIESG